MLPLRDNIGSRHYPVVNTAIIAVNVLVFLHQTTLPSGVSARFLSLYALIPAHFTSAAPALHTGFGRTLFSLVSFQFLHAGFWHLLGNMWVLYIFGDNVEDRIGHLLYLVFYLACGFASAGTHILFFPGSGVPVIGASGSIAGVMGAYFLLHPWAKILTLLPLFIFPYFIELPAFLFLGLWFVLQLVSAKAAMGAGEAAGIAWWAHVGGFAAGAGLILAAPRLPEGGVEKRSNRVTAKRRSPRLSIITPTGPPGDPDVYGELAVTSLEAAHGAKKTVSLPLGLSRGLYSVRVPPGIAEGRYLRLSGLGRPKGGGKRGDLLLRVRISG